MLGYAGATSFRAEIAAYNPGGGNDPVAVAKWEGGHASTAAATR